MAEEYRMSEERIAEVAAVGGFSVALVRNWCLARWPGGGAHQQWLDTAPAGEIAAWIEANAEWTPLVDEPARC
jgi:hypothetical protein